jgi:hypothetical protein
MQARLSWLISYGAGHDSGAAAAGDPGPSRPVSVVTDMLELRGFRTSRFVRWAAA